MSIAKADWQALPEAVRSSLDRHLGLVRPLFREDLEAVILYGRALRPGFRPGRDPIATTLVLNRINLDRVRELSRQGKRLGALGFGAPLILTPRHIRESLDSFPLEMLDIQLNHAVVLGEDPFAGLSFNPAHVRLQCEREVKGVQRRIYQGLLASGAMEFLLGDIEREVGETLVRTLRGMLWLEGHTEALYRDRALDLTEKRMGRPLKGLRVALDEAAQPTWEDFKVLHGDLEALAQKINQAETVSAGGGA